jgi:uncharacterized RDD family membrane protein YckC
MILWIIQDGKKTGPLEDYEIREMIREGKVNRDTRVWHEGADGWLSACDLGVLASEFKVVERDDQEVIQIRPAPFRAWPRLGSRVIDYLIYRSILHFFSIACGVNLWDPVNSSGWVVIGIVLPVILMEAAMVGSLGFTPGKWLLGLRVETLGGQRLSTAQAFVRSMRVWVLGMGMFLPLMMVMGLCMSLWFGKKKGGMLWDLQSGFQVKGEQLTPKRITWFWVILVVIISINVLPYLSEILAGDEQALQEKLLRK